MPSVPIFSWYLAAALLEGEWLPDALIERAAEYLDERPSWLIGLADRVSTAFPSRPDVEALARFIHRDSGFRAATRRVFHGSLAMAPGRWPVPPLPSPAALAEWLGLTFG